MGRLLPHHKMPPRESKPLGIRWGQYFSRRVCEPLETRLREDFQHVNEPAGFLLEEYGVAIQLCRIAMKWNGLKVRHCSFTAPPPVVNEKPNRLFSRFVSGSQHLDFEKDCLDMFNKTALGRWAFT